LDKMVLVVDDETSIREMLVDALARAGFHPLAAVESFEAEKIITDTPHHPILLDWMLPEMSGIDLAGRLKKSDATRDISLIMLTARVEEQDKLRASDQESTITSANLLNPGAPGTNKQCFARATTSGTEEPTEVLSPSSP